MAALKKDGRINLLPKDKFSESPLGRVLRWLLTTFRIMVIAVEMVVMLAFFSRFWLDARNADLNDEIETKEAQIKAFAKFENQFRNLQDRIKIFQALASEERFYSSNINLVSSFLPADVFITSLAATFSEIAIIGVSPSELSIAQFIVNMESSEKVDSVTLTQVDTKKLDEGLIGFTVLIGLKRGAI